MKNIIQKKTILAAVLGNVFEAYDITNFLFLAPFIAQNFFAHEGFQQSFFKTLGVFLIGFLARPLGGIALGLVADLYGRKKSLVMSLVLASFSSALIVVLPGYNTLGSMATFLLICCRVGQSFALGGEYVTSVAFLVEHAPDNQKNFAGSWAAFGANLGVLIASISSACIAYLINQHIWPEWTWRIPFLFSLVGIAVSYWVRRYALESLGFIFENSSMAQRTPRQLWDAMRQFIAKDKTSVTIIFGLTWLVASSYYIVFTYAPLHLVYYSNMYGLFLAAFSVGFLVLLAPVMGRLADKIGCSKLLFWSAMIFLGLAYPYFKMLGSQNIVLIFIMQGLIAIPAAGLYSLILTFIVGMIPIKLRCSLGSFLYSVASSVFGGVAPLVADQLTRSTGESIVPAYYLMFCAVIGLSAIIAYRFLYVNFSEIK